MVDRKALDLLSSQLELSPEQVEEAVGVACEGGYRSWTIPKGDGRERRIEAPAEELKLVQDAILHRLLYRAPISPFAHGFVPGRSIVTNARVHLDTARFLVGLDLEDAYPSVSVERIRRTLEWALGPFVKHSSPTRSRAARSELFDVLTALCSHRGALPQGAPTSGAILNLVCARLDRLVARLIRREPERRRGWRYSRYADDLTLTSCEPPCGDFVDELRSAVRESGFRVNRRKVRVIDVRQRDLVICGVRIHERSLTLERKVLRRYRALFHRVSRSSEVERADRDLVHGALGHITMVTSACPALLRGPVEALVARHGDWLRAPVSRRESPPFPRYGW